MASSDPLPSHLEIGGLRLELHPSPEGPKIDLEPGLESFCWILSMAAEEGGEDVYEAFQTGKQWDHHIMQVAPVKPENDLEGAKKLWKEVTGRELGGELRAMYVGGQGDNIVPLEVLREGARVLRDLRRKHRIEPPWLFLPKSKWDAAHPSERETLLDLERRVEEDSKAAGELASIGLESPEHGLIKLQTMLRWGTLKLALRYETVLRKHDPGLLPEPPWLFLPHPSGEFPHPGEHESLLPLEEEAKAIDRDEKALDGAADPPRLIQRRFRFLAQFRDLGLMSGEYRDDKNHWLGRWKLQTLRTLYKAALDGVDYLQSGSRARYNPDAKETELLDAPVCLDIFRSLRIPDGVNRFDWISWGEYLLRKHGPKRDVTTDQGDFPYHDKDGLIIVLWRKDAGFPALRYVSLRPTPGAKG